MSEALDEELKQAIQLWQGAEPADKRRLLNAKVAPCVLHIASDFLEQHRGSMQADDREDLVITATLKMLHHLEMKGIEVETAGPYLRAICRHSWVDFYRKKGKDKTITIPFATEGDKDADFWSNNLQFSMPASDLTITADLDKAFKIIETSGEPAQVYLQEDFRKLFEQAIDLCHDTYQPMMRKIFLGDLVAATYKNYHDEKFWEGLTEKALNPHTAKSRFRNGTLELKHCVEKAGGAAETQELGMALVDIIIQGQFDSMNVDNAGAVFDPLTATRRRLNKQRRERDR